MRRLLDWIWKRGIVSTFLSGLFALLPVVVTVAIVFWLVNQLHGLLGPGTPVGENLRAIGLRFVTDETTASIIGWIVVLVGIWLLGIVMKSQARQRVEGMVNTLLGHIPFVKSVYGTATQVIGMMQKDQPSDLQGMRVVFCSLGTHHGAGFLALLTSPKTYRFQGYDCHVVYVPTSPLPMSGGILFIPVEAVTRVNMSADQLMHVYLSLGVLAPKVVPKQHQVFDSAADS